MTSTTTSLYLSTTEEFVWWSLFDCSTSGRRAFTVMWCLFVVSLMALMVYIMHSLIKNKPPSTYMSLFYFIWSFVFYVDVIVVTLNHCYWHSVYIQWIGWIIRMLNYSGGFLFFIVLLFLRLYNIFHGTVYALSRGTIICFTIFISIGFIDLLIIIILDSTTLISYFWFVIVGLLMIITTIIWVPGLYIRKLYSVVKAKESMSDDTDTRNMKDDRLLANIAKNTLLTALTLFGTLFTLIIVVVIPQSGEDQFWRRRVIMTFLMMDHTTNLLGFVLGYTYCTTNYLLICRCLDMKTKECVMRCVTLSSKPKKALSVHTAEESTQNVASVNDVSHVTVTSTNQLSKDETFVSDTN